jgi:hypothetical protein
MFEFLELLGCIAAFWNFVFCAEFRAKWVSDFNRAGTFGRTMKLIEGAVATACGLAPFALWAYVMR